MAFKIIQSDLFSIRGRSTGNELKDVCLKKQHTNFNQIVFFKAATGKAFTIVLAGFAFTICILLKISRLPALVAGLTRVLILQTPGIVKTPVFLTSVAATVARVPRSFVHCDFFTSFAAASASASAPFDMTVAFIAGAISQKAKMFAGKTTLKQNCL